MKKTRYTYTGTLPTHCEKISKYWSTLSGFYPYASGHAAGMKYKAVKAFKEGLRAHLPEPMIDQAYKDTLDLTRLLINAN
jgi:hypothetical protein